MTTPTNPYAGQPGSYVEDPDTGEITLIDRTADRVLEQPAPEPDPAPEQTTDEE